MTSKVKRRGESLLKLSLGRGSEPSSLDEERPTFSSRYLSMDVSVKKCDNKVFRKFTARLKALSEMTWKQINAFDGFFHFSLDFFDMRFDFYIVAHFLRASFAMSFSSLYLS